jgi:hypothetical protein
MLITQLGREHTLYLPHGHVHSDADIGSLQIGQRPQLAHRQLKLSRAEGRD